MPDPIPNLKDDNLTHPYHNPTASLIPVAPAFLAQVAQHVQDGLLTPAEAARTLLGQQLSPRLAGSLKAKEQSHAL